LGSAGAGLILAEIAISRGVRYEAAEERLGALGVVLAFGAFELLHDALGRKRRAVLNALIEVGSALFRVETAKHPKARSGGITLIVRHTAVSEVAQHRKLAAVDVHRSIDTGQHALTPFRARALTIAAATAVVCSAVAVAKTDSGHEVGIARAPGWTVSVVDALERARRRSSTPGLRRHYEQRNKQHA